MSTEPMYKCSQCRSHKASNHFGTRQKGGIHRQKGVASADLRVPLAGMTASGKEVAGHVESLAWKATGYRFR